MDLLHLNNAIKDLKKKEKTKFDYHAFSEDNIKFNPFEQFTAWFKEALIEELNPTIMILATIDQNGHPDTRAVALQELEKDKLIFYSTYHGRKASHIAHDNTVSVNFYWPNLGRQIRIKAKVEKISRHRSELYFSNRVRELQISTCAWTQSSVLANREDLEKKIENATNKFLNQSIACPQDWGGYAISPFEYEFYQRRKWLHNDIFLYALENNHWKTARLAP